MLPRWRRRGRRDILERDFDPAIGLALDREIRVVGVDDALLKRAGQRVKLIERAFGAGEKHKDEG